MSQAQGTSQTGSTQAQKLLQLAEAKKMIDEFLNTKSILEDSIKKMEELGMFAKPTLQLAKKMFETTAKEVKENQKMIREAERKGLYEVSFTAPAKDQRMAKSAGTTKRKEPTQSEEEDEESEHSEAPPPAVGTLSLAKRPRTSAPPPPNQEGAGEEEEQSGPSNVSRKPWTKTITYDYKEMFVKGVSSAGLRPKPDWKQFAQMSEKLLVFVEDWDMLSVGKLPIKICIPHACARELRSIVRRPDFKVMLSKCPQLVYISALDPLFTKKVLNFKPFDQIFSSQGYSELDSNQLAWRNLLQPVEDEVGWSDLKHNHKETHGIIYSVFYDCIELLTTKLTEPSVTDSNSTHEHIIATLQKMYAELSTDKSYDDEKPHASKSVKGLGYLEYLYKKVIFGVLVLVEAAIQKEMIEKVWADVNLSEEEKKEEESTIVKSPTAHISQERERTKYKGFRYGCLCSLTVFMAFGTLGLLNNAKNHRKTPSTICTNFFSTAMCAVINLTRAPQDEDYLGPHARTYYNCDALIMDRLIKAGLNSSEINWNECIISLQKPINRRELSKAFVVDVVNSIQRSLPVRSANGEQIETKGILNKEIKKLSQDISRGLGFKDIVNELDALCSGSDGEEEEEEVTQAEKGKNKAVEQENEQSGMNDVVDGDNSSDSDSAAHFTPDNSPPSC